VHDHGVEERIACARLKARFEAAGFHIAENVLFDEDGIHFDLDGFDAERRVGYEYVTEEAGDSWDVDADVREKLAERQKKGELYVLIVDETDPKTLDAKIDAFLAALPKPKPAAKKPAKPPPTPKKAAAKKKPAGRKK
jgi:hypothetical protein